MTSNWSIRRRLFSLWLVMLIIVCGAVYLVTGTIAKKALERGQDNDLNAVAFVILDSMVNAPNGLVFDLPYSAFEVLAYSAPERLFYQVALNDKFLAGYDDLPKSAENTSKVSFRTALYRGEETRFVYASKPIKFGSGEKIWVIIGQTSGSYFEFASTIANWIAVTVFAAFCILALWAELSLRHSLKPFAAVEKDLAQRAADDFSPISRNTPTEITRLVTTLNETLGQHQELLRQNRAFIAEATHQIKTPIAAMLTAAEILEREVADHQKEKVHKLIVRARYASKIVTQLLTRASLAYREMLKIRENVNLTQLAESVIRAFDPIAESKEIELSVDAPSRSINIVGDKVALREALVCLVDNAIRHSPILSEVTISVFQGEETVSLIVSDHGTGFTTEPHLSIEASLGKTENRASTGLGLSIVKRVAHYHSADLILSNQPEGGSRCGLCFRLS